VDDQHKESIRIGREEKRVVREYLQSLRAGTRRGRPRTAQAVASKLADVEQQLADASADRIAVLRLTQARFDLRAELDAIEMPGPDADTLEKAFVGAARSYGERHGIEYRAWREVGVPVAVLTEAGISR
jgi:hypothetical protein